MPVNPALAVIFPAAVSLYRITAVSFNTPNAAHHKKVVNGMGARKSHAGARYNYGGVLTVYLADSVETVDTGNDPQIVAGKRVVFKSPSNVK